MEKMIIDIQPIKKDDDNSNKQIDLINIHGHQPFDYEFMLKKIADQI